MHVYNVALSDVHHGNTRETLASLAYNSLPDNLQLSVSEIIGIYKVTCRIIKYGHHIVSILVLNLVALTLADSSISMAHAQEWPEDLVRILVNKCVH